MPNDNRLHFLVTGANGMLGHQVVRVLRERGFSYKGTDVDETDLTVKGEAESLVQSVSPNHIIHCAAYTNVDRAEEDREAVHAANVEATRTIAECARAVSARLIFISTDFIFDGKSDHPYRSDDPPAPLSVYGQSKWDGEQAVRETLKNHVIVRTSWLFGPGGRNFVKAIAGLLDKGESPRVVCDQTGAPTYSIELAERLVDMALLKDCRGTWHVTNAGHCSWYEYARAIAEETGHPGDVIQAVTAKEWGASAERPEYSVLDCSETWGLGIKPLPLWRESLRNYLQNYL